MILPADHPDWQRHLITDPQTSGGLLVACAPQSADAVLTRITAARYPSARRIGWAEADIARLRIVA